MSDPTQTIRKLEQRAINANPSPKEQLEEQHGVGNVWTTSELQQEFTVLKGSVKFQHDPRIYYSFQPE